MLKPRIKKDPIIYAQGHIYLPIISSQAYLHPAVVEITLDTILYLDNIGNVVPNQLNIGIKGRYHIDGFIMFTVTPDINNYASNLLLLKNGNLIGINQKTIYGDGVNDHYASYPISLDTELDVLDIINMTFDAGVSGTIIGSRLNAHLIKKL